MVLGRAKVGDKCPSKRASARSHWFCGGHLRQWNMENDPERVRRENAKGSETRKTIGCKFKQKNREIVARSREILGKETMSILKEMGLQEEFDLEQEYVLLKNINPDPTKERYAEKMAYFMYLATPEPMRRPQEIGEVCKILGVVQGTLAQWRRSPECIRAVNENVRDVASRSYRFVWEKLMEGVSRGDVRSMDIALKHIKEQDAKRPVNNDKLNVSDALKQRAAEICNENGDPQLRGVADKAKKAAVYDGMISGGAKDIPQ